MNADEQKIIADGVRNVDGLKLRIDLFQLRRSKYRPTADQHNSACTYYETVDIIWSVVEITRWIDRWKAFDATSWAINFVSYVESNSYGRPTIKLDPKEKGLLFYFFSIYLFARSRTNWQTLSLYRTPM